MNDGDGEGRKPAPSRKFGTGERERDFVELSEEETRRIREVLAKVWQDPGVMAAKESVRVSTDQYREELRKAVLRVDPEVAELMNKFHEGSRSMEMRKHFEENMGRDGGMPGGPGRGPGMGPGGEPFMSDLPEFLRALDDEQKRIYFAAREKAEKSEKFAGLREEMNALEKQERGSREERFKLMARLRRTMREEIVRIDPRVAEFLPEAPKERPAGAERPDREKVGPDKGRPGDTKGEPRPVE